ncbi:hypothetical protein ACFZBU_40535 [Embleya sp. NPDC008237]|uniref:hypothetical protein n=1 Tax=Embleya sp. NPDC008237 TaxID=3363978 RepID=UPI0036E013CD
MVGIPIVSHVLPSLALIRELVARRHRATYANDPFVADRIESAGAELVPCTSTLPVVDNDWPADPIAAASLFLDDAIQALPQLHTAYDDDPADLYLYDVGAYAARALAEAQGRPVVQLSPTFVGWGGYEEEVAAHLRKLPGADAYQDRFARWFADCGATTKDVDTFSGSPTRTLALIPRAMQPHADRVDTDRVTFVGPCFDTRDASRGAARPGHGPGTCRPVQAVAGRHPGRGRHPARRRPHREHDGHPREPGRPALHRLHRVLTLGRHEGAGGAARPCGPVDRRECVPRAAAPAPRSTAGAARRRHRA